MSRIFCIPGIIILFLAFVASVLTSISLPFLTSLDITRTTFGSHVSSGSASGSGIDEIRFGVWSFCVDDNSGDRTCSPKHHGYIVSVNDESNNSNVIIGSSWTRGLAVHPVATAVTFIALLFSFSTHVTVTLIASLLSFFAALITLIAFAIDIALLAFTKHEFNKLAGTDPNTSAGPGFWLTFVSLILLLLAGCTVCFGRRRRRMDRGAGTYAMSDTRRPGFFGRFRRNKAAY